MKVVIQKDPKGILGREIIERKGCAFDVALEFGCRHDNATIFVNGKLADLPVVADGRIVDRGDEQELTKQLGSDDVVVIILEPKGGAVIAFAVIAVIAALVAVALVPDFNPNAETQNQTTNNKLYGQENSARLYQAIPSAYGLQTMYPDLATSEAAREYVANDAELQQLMILGFGTYEKQDILLGSTLLSQITGATAAWYEPDSITGITTVPEHEVQFTVNQVDGQKLPGTEGKVIPLSIYNTTASYDSDNDLGTITVNPPSSDPLLNQFIDVGDTVTLIGSYFLSGFSDAGILDGSYVVSAVDDRSITFEDAALVSSDWTVVASSSDLAFIDSSLRITKAGGEQEIGPFDTAIAAQGVLVDFVFPRGINGEVILQVDVDEIDEQGGSIVSGGVSVSIQYTYSGSTIEPQYRTERPYEGITGGAKRFFRVSVTRKNDASTDTTKPNDATWARLSSYTIEQNKEFENVTMLLVNIPSSAQSISPRENQVNVDAERKTITYDTTTQQIVATLDDRGSRCADAILHEYTEVFGRDASELDLDELYAIQENGEAIDARLFQFASTFDDIELSLGDRIRNICDTMRVTPWHDGNTWRFYRYEAKNPSGIITRRDLAANRNYNRTFQPRMPSDKDSVKLEWVDPATNKKSYIYRSYDASGNILTTQGSNPVNVQLNGCRNLYQAENRADIEIRRILYEREFLTDTCLQQCMLYDLGDIVKYADVYRTDVFDGEILAIDSLTAYTSERFIPEIGKTYEVEFNDDIGNSYGPYLIESVASNEKAFSLLEGDFANAYTAGSGLQLGSRYIISEVETAEPDFFWITGKSPADKDVDLQMSQYDARVFEVDP